MRTAAGALALSAILIGAWQFGRGSTGERHPTLSSAARSAASSRLTSRRIAPWRARLMSAGNNPAASSAARAEPITIDEVTIEKHELCSGEEALVSVRAHTNDETDAFLRYQVGSGGGTSVPVRLFRQPDGSVSLPEIRVFGQNGKVAKAAFPSVELKECEARHLLLVSARLMANTRSTYEISARVQTYGRGQTRPLRPRSFRWSFGDGAVENSTIPVATHTFSLGTSQRIYPAFLIRVEATDAAGNTVVGRSSVQLLNMELQNFLEKQIITLVSEAEPRFPMLDAEGRVHQVFSLRHYYEVPIRIERVHVISQYRAGESQKQAVAPSGVLGGNVEIAPGQTIKVSRTLDTREEPEVVARIYQLEGVSADGYPVRGMISLMRPPPTPTKTNSVRVAEASLVEKILQARRILGRNYVTDEDIWRLEREGHLPSKR